MNIKDIQDAIQENRLRISDHAHEEAASDLLTFDEIYFSVLHGETIEDYPTGRLYPSCLIYGQNFAGEPIHTVWGYNASTRSTVLVTVYRPDPELWIDCRTRKKA